MYGGTDTVSTESFGRLNVQYQGLYIGFYFHLELTCLCHRCNSLHFFNSWNHCCGEENIRREVPNRQMHAKNKDFWNQICDSDMQWRDFLKNIKPYGGPGTAVAASQNNLNWTWSCSNHHWSSIIISACGHCPGTDMQLYQIVLMLLSVMTHSHELGIAMRKSIENNQ